MKKKIVIVGHGLVPSALSDKLLNENDNEIVIVGSLENPAVKQVIEQLESEGKKVTVVSEEDFKNREMGKKTENHPLLESLVNGEYVKESIRRYEESKEIFELADNLMYDKPTKKQMNQVVVPVRTEPKYQNNEPCPCGSGNKYKKCCKKV